MRELELFANAQTAPPITITVAQRITAVKIVLTALDLATSFRLIMFLNSLSVIPHHVDIKKSYEFRNCTLDTVSHVVSALLSYADIFSVDYFKSFAV